MGRSSRVSSPLSGSLQLTRVSTALDNGRCPPRKLLRAVVARLLGRKFPLIAVLKMTTAARPATGPIVQENVQRLRSYGSRHNL